MGLLRMRIVLAVLMTSALALVAHARTVDVVDLSGFWEPMDMEDFQSSYTGPDPVDFTGLPINDSARARGLSYSDGLLSLPERQCIYYPPTYLVVGPFGFRIEAQSDAVSGNTVAWRIAPWIDRPAIEIRMDGRLQPGPEAMHTFAGFTTGVWQGHTLTTFTTHFREGPLRRNGIPSSDQASMTMHFTRHGDYLEVTALITDPVYLTEPYVLSRLYRLNPSAYLKNDFVIPCVPRRTASIKAGMVPHYLPGQNPVEQTFAQHYGLPLEAALGGAQTLYPEYRHVLEGKYQRPDRMCDGWCCGWGDTRNPDNFNRYGRLMCPGNKRTSPEVLPLIDKEAQ